MMSRITYYSGPDRTEDREGGGPPGILAHLLGAVIGLAPACRSATALAMMSERELDDLGLLAWEIRAEIDGGADDRAALRRFRMPVACNQA